MSDLENNDGVATPQEDKVDLPEDIKKKVDINDVPDDLALFMTELNKKKKKANDEAKQLRLEKQELLDTMSQKEDEIKQSYELQLEEWKTKYEALHNEMKTKKAEKAKAELDLAMQKYNAKDNEVVESLLTKHLKSIREDQEKMNSFNIDDWMKELTESKSFLFGKEQEDKPANFGAGTQTQSETGLKPNDKNSFSDKDKEELKNDWAEFEASLNGVDM